MPDSTPHFLPRFRNTKSHLPPLLRSIEHSSDQHQRCQYSTGWLSCRFAHANRAAAFCSSRSGRLRQRHFCTPDSFKYRYTVFFATCRPHSSTNWTAVSLGFIAIALEIRLPSRSEIGEGRPERGREIQEVCKVAFLTIVRHVESASCSVRDITQEGIP
jgi:hypothetical protein